jgi:murein DD-endopeptidase MepM/ murein hydrolase activator NlpD
MPIGPRRVAAGALALLAAACGPGLQPITVPTPTPPPAEGPGAPPAADAAALAALDLMVPVAGVTPGAVPDNYAARRGDRLHAAIDIAAARGTPVLAAADGVVRRVGENALGGRTVYAVDTAERFVFYYAHLDRWAAGVREGQRVRAGDVLGYVGTTGNAPPGAPHLHFQVMRMGTGRQWWSGAPVNPIGAFRRKGEAEKLGG